MKNTTRFMLFNVLLVAMALATAAAMFLAEIHQESKVWALHEQEQHLKTFWELLRNKGRNFRIVDGNLMVDSYVVNGNFELPDKMNDIFGCTATIFMGDIRVSTSVRKADESRAVGTQLQGAAREAIFKEGKPYRGEALILGIPYLTAYDPIRNEKGEIIGALYVGVKESTYFVAYDKLRFKVIAVTSLLMCIFSLLAALLIRFRKHAVEVLKESESKYRQLFELQSDAILLIDGETCAIMEANASAVKLYGFGRDEFLAKKSYELTENPQEKCTPAKELEQHIPVSMHKKKDGTVFPVEIFTSLYKLKKNTALIAVIRDITELKKTDDALRETIKEYQGLVTKFDEKQNLLHTLIDAIPDLIFYKDLEGRYFGCNRAFETFAGLSEEMLIGLTDFDLFPKEMATLFREMDCQMLSQHAARRNEEWVDYPDGRRVLLDTLKTPFYDHHGNSLGLIGISRDITERSRAEGDRKNLEAQLYQAQKMEAIGQLAGGIAHDFNNILTVIIGYSEIILFSMESHQPLRRHVEQVLVSAGRAAELTAGLLAFSRKQLLHTKPLDLGDVARGLRTMLRRLIPEDIDFKTIVAEKTLTIMADKGQIEQVIMNLVTNAKDAMPKGGCLTVEISTADLDNGFLHQHGFGEPGRYGCITITDTGHGMDQETCNRIFEPFFTTKEPGKGTGLGMAIIYGIVKQHNGYITVDSKPGRGTVFCVYLPLIASMEQDALAPNTTAPPLGGTETILLAEDDETVRELHCMILEEAGYTIIEAEDGQDALDKFLIHQTEVDILVTDVIMPKIDGKHLYEEIRKIRSEMKVLMMSGYTNDVFVERGILEDEYNFLAKPVMPSDLLKTLRNILDNQQNP
ncbi:MAG: PAS domain S-box protein [Desulfuromonadales bacterium]|nr:PAS domain S-box protein [Desulfuromonadales bacterium]